MLQELKKKTLAELKQLNDKNLLAYYKAERKRFYSFSSTCICGCCGEYYWNLDSKSDFQSKEKYYSWSEYLEGIKAELSTRGHVQK